MSVVKFIQHQNLSNNEIQDVRLQANPVMTSVDLTGKFGINSQGGFIYIAGYVGSTPVINNIKEYVPYEPEAGATPYIVITNNIANFKHGISVNIPALLEKILKDNENAVNSTWSSKKIVEYIETIIPKTLPILDEDNLTMELTGEELEELYPSAPIGSVYFSKIQGIKYTKLGPTAWTFEIIDIR